jgi:F1F0 ATPase subunit 2
MTGHDLPRSIGGLDVSDVIALGVGLVAGVILGAVFFGGLWWTTQRLPTTPRPALLLSSSLLVRVLALAVGLLLIAQLGGGALLFAALGLVAARIGLTRLAVRGRLPQPATSDPTVSGGP